MIAAFDIIHVDLFNVEHKQLSLLDKTPVGNLPVLEDDDLSFFDSSAIATYVAEKFKETGYFFCCSTVCDNVRKKVISLMVKSMNNPISTLVNTSIMAAADISNAFCDKLLAFTDFGVFDRLIDKLESSFHQWERIPPDTGEQVNLTKELLANCESIQWQVDELDKTIDVAARDPSWYGIDDRQLESRRRWTSTTRTQVGNVKKSLVVRKENGNTAIAMRRELMKLPNSHQPDRSNQYDAEDDNDFIASESDRQMLLIK